MVSPEEYETLKKGKPEVKEETNPKLKGPDDVKLKLFYDHQARKAAKQKNREETEAAQLQKRIQPLLALHSGNLAEVLKKFPQDKQAQANFILLILSRLPKVSIVRDYLTIDGEPLKEPAHQIVTDIMNNGVTGSQKVIEALRRGVKKTPTTSSPSASKLSTTSRLPASVRSKVRADTIDDSDSFKSFEDFDDEMQSFVSDSAFKTPLKTPTRSKIRKTSTPKSPRRKQTPRKPPPPPKPKTPIRGSPIVTDQDSPLVTRRNRGDKELTSPRTALLKIQRAKQELRDRQKEARAKRRDAGRADTDGDSFEQSGNGRRQKWETFN